MSNFKTNYKDERRRLDRVMFYLTLPIVVLYVFIVFIVVLINPAEYLSAYLAAVAIATVFIVLIETHVFRTRIMNELIEKDRIQKLLEEQDRSGRLLIRRDLELTRANELLRELDRRKSEFISVVAHQLRTPLSGMKWTMNMLLNGDLGNLSEEQRSFIMKGYDNNQRMINLIEDMLGADRVSSGKLQYTFAALNIPELIDNVLYEVMPIANRKNIKLNYVNRNDALPKVSVDQEKIRQVVQNLVENAIKYSNENGTIKIETKESKEEKGYVQVSVTDDGIGIPEAEKKNIFNRFFRAPNAVKHQTDGSGLGLFIVKGIVERHGGRVWFESREGQGTTFYFTVKVG